MTLAADLDTWVAALATAVGIPATRDPSAIFPPCLFADAPDVVGVTIGSTTLDMPLWLVADGAGKAALDQILAYLPAVLAECKVKTATYGTLPVGGANHRGYQIPVPLHLT